MYKFETKKDYIKTLRCFIELVVLIFILYIIIRAMFVFTTYQPYDESVVTGEDNGFIALSYFGVDREGTSTLISTENLEAQLKALYDNGYVTITQEDIENYYLYGTPLPEKALFLMFEDGRRDTAIFAQGIMERYNYIATIMSYAQYFEERNSKFLSVKDLNKLLKNSYWELGTNGYRLSYINVFDRYDNYIGELNSVEYSKMSKYLGRNYNQYLMDYIRDENGIPLESYNQMYERISGDYLSLKVLYEDNFGYIPSVYVLMHANTGRFGNNDKVSNVNAEYITSMFAINFNREGYSLNNQECNVYDLTRMQPQAYWSTNHLLMRIRDDLDEEDRDSIQFVVGDEVRSEYWELIEGAAEFTESSIIVTSLSKANGTIRLDNNEEYDDFSLDVTLTGNVIGTQNIWIRANEDASEGICISLSNNNIYIYDTASEDILLYEEDLYYFDGNERISVEEDEQAVLMGEYEVMSVYTNEFDENKTIASEMNPISVEDGAEEYVPTIQINALGSRNIHLDIKGDKLTVYVDGKILCENIEVITTDEGSVLLQASWCEYGYSQRNITDDIYDARFENFYISEYQNPDNKMFSNKLEGWAAIWAFIVNIWNAILNWFIKYL